MMNLRYKKTVCCYRCKKTIVLPKDTVIEWAEFGIGICHFDCSAGPNGYTGPLSTMELDSPFFSKEYVYTRLGELANEKYGEAALQLREELFDL